MTTEASQSMLQKIIKVAWMSLVLGIGMEILLLIVAAGFKNSLTVKPIVTDLVQKTSWSLFVCIGLAAGTAATRMRTAVMGLAGLLSAPIAFHIAKVMHKSANQLLGVVSAQTAGPPIYLLALIKGIEYASLGILLSLLEKRKVTKILPYVLTGLTVGTVFGSWMVCLMIKSAGGSMSLFGIVSRMVNEILFPVGCSMVLYFATGIAKHNYK